MKRLLTTLVILTGLFAPSLAVGGEGVKIGDLVERGDLYYKKFSNEPFTGKTTGWYQWTFRRGKQEGPYFTYWFDGQLARKGTYKDGKQEGPTVLYYKNGQLAGKGTYKDDKKEGPWVFYKEDGTKDLDGKCCYFHAEGTGTYRYGKKVSD